MKTERHAKLTALLDGNFGYVEEEQAGKLAERLIENGVIFSQGILEMIVKHGTYSAAKWAGHPNEREHWNARYTAVAIIYRDLTDTPSWLEDFNRKCGVNYVEGNIISADGTACKD